LPPRRADGAIVGLRDQDRSLWDTEPIAEGHAVLDRALALGGSGEYMLQAAIASLHVEAAQDWPQLAILYGGLSRLTGSPVVVLNHAAALAEAGDVETALAIVDRLDLDHYHYLHSTRAELLRRLDRLGDARDAYRHALERAHSDAGRRFLEQRLTELETATTAKRQRNDAAGSVCSRSGRLLSPRRRVPAALRRMPALRAERARRLLCLGEREPAGRLTW
jgi:RNA polymerase sigma-70 factor (ECF subfamily)